MRARLGLSYKPVKNGLVAMDIGDRLHLGSEYTYADILSLRFGLERDLEGEKETEFSFGTGIKYKMLQFDYAYRYHPHLETTSYFSASVFFNFGYSLVDVKNTKTVNNQGLYPSLWKQYANEPFLEFELENKEDRPLKCSWSVELQDLLGEPATGELILRPYETQKIAVAGTFSEKFLAAKSDNFKSGKIKVKYKRDRSTKEYTRNFQTFIFGHGAIDWNTDMNWIGAFINPDDPEIREIAVEATDYIEKKGYINANARNIYYAMAIFNGLKAQGLKYLPDPNRPYQRVGDENAPVDNVQYPLELLNSGAGDCDDITALMCALLESIGIRTVVLDVPGHLFMMFDTGIPEMYALSLMLDRENMVIFDGNIFIPLEITELENGFMKAWQIGSAACNRWATLEELNMIDIHSSWNIYTPVPISIQRRTKNIDSESWWSGVNKDMYGFNNKQQEFVNMNYARNIEKVRDKAVHLNELAMAALLEGDVDRCLASLKEGMKLDGENTGIIMNLANAYAMEGNFAEAEKLYNDIKSPDSILMAVKYNKTIVYCLMSENSESLPNNLLPAMREYLGQYDDSAQYTYYENRVNHCFEDANIFGKNLAGCIKTALKSQDDSIDEIQAKAGILDAGQTGEERWFLWYGLDF
jgi:hypothetical protein